MGTVACRDKPCGRQSDPAERRQRKVCTVKARLLEPLVLMDSSMSTAKDRCNAVLENARVIRFDPPTPSLQHALGTRDQRDARGTYPHRHSAILPESQSYT